MGPIGKTDPVVLRSTAAEVEPDTAELRKARGAFFAPEARARYITDWAVRSVEDRVLEPSCGEAAFLLAAVDRLAALWRAIVRATRRTTTCSLRGTAAHFTVGAGESLRSGNRSGRRQASQSSEREVGRPRRYP